MTAALKAKLISILFSLLGITSISQLNNIGAFTVIAPVQGGTGKDTSAWTGVLQVSSGVFSTTTPGLSLSYPALATSTFLNQSYTALASSTFLSIANSTSLQYLNLSYPSLASSTFLNQSYTALASSSFLGVGYPALATSTFLTIANSTSLPYLGLSYPALASSTFLTIANSSTFLRTTYPALASSTFLNQSYTSLASSSFLYIGFQALASSTYLTIANSTSLNYLNTSYPALATSSFLTISYPALASSTFASQVTTTITNLNATNITSTKAVIGTLNVTTCVGCGGGSQTPWTSDINGGGFILNNVGTVSTTQIITSGSGVSKINGGVGTSVTTTNLYVYDNAVLPVDSVSFLELFQTPDTFAGSGGYFVKVNAAATGVEFVAGGAGGGDAYLANNQTFTGTNIFATTTASILTLNLGDLYSNTSSLEFYVNGTTTSSLRMKMIDDAVAMSGRVEIYNNPVNQTTTIVKVLNDNEMFPTITAASTVAIYSDDNYRWLQMSVAIGGTMYLTANGFAAAVSEYLPNTTIGQSITSANLFGTNWLFKGGITSKGFHLVHGVSTTLFRAVTKITTSSFMNNIATVSNWQTTTFDSNAPTSSSALVGYGCNDEYWYVVSTTAVHAFTLNSSTKQFTYTRKLTIPKFMGVTSTRAFANGFVVTSSSAPFLSLYKCDGTPNLIFSAKGVAAPANGPDVIATRKTIYGLNGKSTTNLTKLWSVLD